MTKEEKVKKLEQFLAQSGKKLDTLLGGDDSKADYQMTSEGVSVPIFPKSKEYEEVRAKYSIPLNEKRFNLKEADRVIRNIEGEIEKVNNEREKYRGIFTVEANEARMELNGKTRLLEEQLQEAQNHRTSIDFNGKLNETMTEIFNKI